MFLEVSALKVRQEGMQQQVVRQEAGIVYREDGIHGDAIHEDRILPHCRCRGRFHHGVEERHRLHRVVVLVVPILIV